ncbi:septum formation family protein [Micromonospora sp. PLK6-60]|uniref:septum formation family protein n=1 Tax=Micromonospora sp. PLK6-60 TaxID=2873383 RepID=UPI001CA72A41|nr:septum formation family protein [Micromonospora sp. PLK6-60]MBY8874568.1 septum formation family protein [Micromonospora sp. PLK6-60]
MVRIVLVGLLVAATGACHSGSEASPARSDPAFLPASGACHQTMTEGRHDEAYRPIPCSSRHETETLLVSSFGGVDAEAEAAPDADSEAMFRVYDACDRRAEQWLGGDWRKSRLAMKALVPSADQWSAGERWYRCDVAEMEALDLWVPIPRANSLKGALRGDSPMLLACFREPRFDGDDLLSIPPASCTGPHDTEFVGTWRSELTPDDESISGEDLDEGCWGIAASFVDVPEKTLRKRMRIMTTFVELPEWTAGFPGGLCFLQAPSHSLTRSLRGAGAGGLPSGGA